MPFVPFMDMAIALNCKEGVPFQNNFGTVLLLSMYLQKLMLKFKFLC